MTGEDQDRLQPDTDDERVLIRHMLQLTPEQRLLGLRRASEFFTAAKRVPTRPPESFDPTEVIRVLDEHDVH